VVVESNSVDVVVVVVRVEVLNVEVTGPTPVVVTFWVTVTYERTV
jgi:hypothetical protein